MQLPADTYSIRIKEIEAGKGELRPTMLLAMDPKGGVPDLPGERDHGAGVRPAGAVDRSVRQGGGAVPRLHRGRSAERADHPPDRDGARERRRAAVLRRDPEAAGRAAARAAEAGGRSGPVADHAWAACSACCRRCWPSGCRSATWRPSWKASRRRAAAPRAPSRRSSRMCARGWRGRSATAIPARTATSRWSRCRRNGRRRSPRRWPARRRNASSRWRRSKLQAFMQALRTAFDTAAATGETPVLLTSGGIRAARARDRRAHPPEHAGAGAGGDLPAGADPHGGDDMMRSPASGPSSSQRGHWCQPRGRQSSRRESALAGRMSGRTGDQAPFPLCGAVGTGCDRRCRPRPSHRSRKRQRESASARPAV